MMGSDKIVLNTSSPNLTWRELDLIFEILKRAVRGTYGHCGCYLCFKQVVVVVVVMVISDDSSVMCA